MEQMKTKRFFLLLAAIICTTVLVLFYEDPSVQPSIHNLVTETQTRLNSWKSQKSQQEFPNPDPEEKYLKQLGFNIDQPRLYSKTKWTNVSLPVFVTATSPSDSHFVIGFLKSFQHYYPNHFLIIYDLGLDISEYSLINGICNGSNCIIRNFDFNAYPPHVKNLQLYAFRPIIIQEVLNQAGAVIMLDIHYSFFSSDIQNLVNRAEKKGIVSWTINQPTSALTHPRMFDYFNTKQEKFYFHRMVEPNHILFYNIHPIHFGVMFPWVKCALVPNCIAPIGAQNSGCRFDKKPLYRYSGCHRYDTSALNVVLGLMFDFSSSQYAAKEVEKFFQITDENKILPILVERNTTSLSDFI